MSSPAPAAAAEVAASRIRLTRQGPVATLELADPGRRNALSLAMMRELLDTLDRCAADRAIRTIVLCAEGPVFSSGHDLKELTSRRSDADGGKAFFHETFELCATLMQRIVGSPKPVIAAVEGMATAAGCQIVASCDLAIADERAGFCTPGVNIGLFCSTPMVALSRAVVRHHAMEMLLTGEPVSAQEAFRFGLVNRVVPAGEARGLAHSFAERIASKSPEAVTTGKAAFARQAELPLAQAYAEMSRVMVENLLGPDAVEGVGAFLGKRSPEWPSA